MSIGEPENNFPKNSPPVSQPGSGRNTPPVVHRSGSLLLSSNNSSKADILGSKFINIPKNGTAATTSNGDQGTANNSSQSPPTVVRRSSFGLNFLSSFTNSIRTNPANNNNNSNNNLGSNSVDEHATHNERSSPPIPQDSPHNFMSNSPTIANLNSYSNAAPNVSNDPNENNVQHGPNGVSGLRITSGISGNNSSSDLDEELPGVTPTQTEPRSSVLSAVEEALSTGGGAVLAPDVVAASTTAAIESNGIDKDGFFSVRLTPLIDHSSSTSGLYFAPIIRKMKPKNEISIGRYTEKNKSAAHAPQGSSSPIVFKSKVVSRTHALFQCNDDGQWFLKDCKSSSGTFLNHIRLSPASQELTLMPLIDGDIIQLGMDYRGGTEEVYRCVKMRCEFNKSWQRKVNQFNLEIHKKLKNLAINPNDQLGQDLKLNPLGGALASDDLSECAICLLKLEPCQALFISPCSHSWHYKCIRPIIIKSYPQFYCPNCRSMCDLETDIEDDE